MSGFSIGDRVITQVPLNGKRSYAEMALVPVGGS
jgi:hypothetical protein